MFTGSEDGEIQAYEKKNGRLMRVFEGHNARINDIITVGDKMFSGSTDQKLKVWNIKNIHSF